MKRSLPGINIQYPISQLIVDGKKTIETRTYALPTKYVGQELFLVETPGKSGNFQARITGIIRFGEPFLYRSKKDFYSDQRRHHVDPESDWAWTGKAKWGWPIQSVQKIKTPLSYHGVRGIRFTKSITLSF